MASTMIPPPHAPEFLASCGWPGAQILPLAGDASFRRYFRVVEGDRSAVLMDAPPPHEDPRPFVAVAEWLASVGLSAPQILARDLDKGLLLLGDFGDWRLREILDEDPQRERDLYELATDVLVHLHRHPPMAGLRPHGLDQWLDELMLFTEWYCPAVGADVDVDGYRAAWTRSARAGRERRPRPGDGAARLSCREHHAGRRPRRRRRISGCSISRTRVAGHPAYDLASVLEDARRDVPPEIERAMIDRYVAATGHGDAFERAYWALAAQRNTRILGVFTRLWKRDGKPHYRRFQPRMWGLLERDLAQPHLKPVRDWFDANIRARASPRAVEGAA